MNSGFDNKKLCFGVMLADGTIEELQPLGEIQEIVAEPLESNVEEKTATLIDKAGIHTFTIDMIDMPLVLQEIFLKHEYKKILKDIQSIGKELRLDKRRLKRYCRRLRVTYNKILKSIKE